MKRYEFIVHGPLMGYHQTTKKSIFHPKERAKSKAYGAFKNRVLLLSMEAGAPNIGRALKNHAPRLSVEIFWKEDTRLDWKNVYGAIEDGLFYEDDACVIPGRHSNVHWDTGKEEAKVVLELP